MCRFCRPLFAAGAVGGVVNFLIAPLFGILHITLALGVNIAPPFSKVDLYSKVVWGGIWGFVFMSPSEEVGGQLVVACLYFWCVSVPGSNLLGVPSCDALRHWRGGARGPHAPLCLHLQHPGVEHPGLWLVQISRL
eukprot:jgi/Botrbrau1/5235/Bobra.0172s0097.1